MKCENKGSNVVIINSMPNNNKQHSYSLCKINPHRPFSIIHMLLHSFKSIFICLFFNYTTSYFVLSLSLIINIYCNNANVLVIVVEI